MGNHHDNGVTAIKLRLALPEGLVLSHVVGTADIDRRYVNGDKVRSADFGRWNNRRVKVPMPRMAATRRKRTLQSQLISFELFLASHPICVFCLYTYFLGLPLLQMRLTARHRNKRQHEGLFFVICKA